MLLESELESEKGGGGGCLWRERESVKIPMSTAYWAAQCFILARARVEWFRGGLVCKAHRVHNTPRVHDTEGSVRDTPRGGAAGHGALLSLALPLSGTRNPQPCPETLNPKPRPHR